MLIIDAFAIRLSLDGVTKGLRQGRAEALMCCYCSDIEGSVHVMFMMGVACRIQIREILVRS